MENNNNEMEEENIKQSDFPFLKSQYNGIQWECSCCCTL